MKNWILWLLISFSATTSANTIDCSVYQDKIRKLEDLRRHGGKLKQMQRWREQTDELSSKQSHCNSQNPIQIATGKATSPSTSLKTKTSGNKNSLNTNAAKQVSLSNNEILPSSVDLPIVRSLKDCIKPNNLIDKDVQECRQGLRDPIWKH